MSVETMDWNVCILYMTFEYPPSVRVMNLVVEPVKISLRLVGALVMATEKWSLTAKVIFSLTKVLMYTGSRETMLVTTI